jgi:hypothetical protein
LWWNATDDEGVMEVVISFWWWGDVGRMCSSREVREEEDSCTEFTEDFTGRRRDGDGLFVKRSEWRRCSSVEVNGEMGMRCGMLQGSSGGLL